MSATTEERLAALQARQRGARDRRSAGGPQPLTRPTGVPLALHDGSPPVSPSRGSRRRLDATAPKILFAGASTTAVLGLTAVMGFASRPGAAVEDVVVTPPKAAERARPSIETVPVGEPVVVVVLDAGGVPLGTATIDPGESAPTVLRLDYLVEERSVAREPASSRPRRDAPGRPAVNLEEVPVPRVVDVAVPVPPTPSAAPPVAPTPAPAPVEATSSGS